MDVVARCCTMVHDVARFKVHSQWLEVDLPDLKAGKLMLIHVDPGSHSRRKSALSQTPRWW